MRIKFKLMCLALIILLNNVYGQSIPMAQEFNGRNTPHINYFVNRIYNSSELNDFFWKLYDLKKNRNRLVKIVHIGDSHIQADFLSGYIRNNLQAFFGNAGRGLIFPYQVSKSNSPPDIISSSNTPWEFNRVAHPEIPIKPGVSGYVIQTNSLSVNIEIRLDRAGKDSALNFKRLKFFIDSGKYTSWVLHAGDNAKAYFVNNDNNEASVYREVVLDNYTNNLSLTAIPTSTVKSFYGVSVENDHTGILYHTIGVNGARYDQFNIASLYWQQISGLQADLYIISLGTNEAQQAVFNEAEFRMQIGLMINNIKNASPLAAILITTTPDSFKKRKPNPILRQLNRVLNNFCNENKIPLWDLYGITNGYGSCYNWLSKGLMRNDRIHFTPVGYQLQGQLLFNALAKEYNEFIKGN